MSQSSQPAGTCPKCGGIVERGFTTALGLIGGDKTEGLVSQLLFVVPGARVASNPIRAFKQGLADEPSNRSYRLNGLRCSNCGFVEFYAEEK
jgi:predicted nucleic-acid-binding Zn-ribbon protein